MTDKKVFSRRGGEWHFSASSVQADLAFFVMIEQVVQVPTLIL